MPFRTVVVILFILLLSALAGLNWSAFVAPVRLDLIAMSFEAPLGLLLAGLSIVIILIFAAYMATWQGKILVEAREHAKAMEKQRQLAEQAEASRVKELRDEVVAGFAQLSAGIQESQVQIRKDIRESGNSLAAVLADMRNAPLAAGTEEVPAKRN